MALTIEIDHARAPAKKTAASGTTVKVVLGVPDEVGDVGAMLAFDDAQRRS